MELIREVELTLKRCSDERIKRLKKVVNAEYDRRFEKEKNNAQIIGVGK